MNLTAHSRRLMAARWPFYLLLLLISLTVTSTKVFAQSTQVVGERQATAQGIADAVRQNEAELIDREVFGGGSAAGSLGIGTFTTGRIRTSDHDGLSIRVLANPNPGAGLDDGTRHTFSYKTDEASLFVNAVITAPGTVLGGQLKFAGFVGGNWLTLEVKPNATQPGIPGSNGTANNESLIAGGTVLWSRERTYALATVVGNWGNSRLTDPVGDFPNVHRYSFNTWGFIGSLTAGQVFVLTANTSGPMLDLRGTVSYSKNQNDPFQNVFGDQFNIKFSTWTGTVGATLYSNMALPNNAVLRPFIQGYVRQELSYDYTLLFTQSGSGDYLLAGYNQQHTYPGVDVGLTYVVKNFTFGASAYFEGTRDERTLGGRFRASWALN